MSQTEVITEAKLETVIALSDKKGHKLTLMLR